MVDTTSTLSQTIVHDTIGGGAVFQHADRYRTLQLDDVDTLSLKGLKYDTALRMVYETDLKFAFTSTSQHAFSCETEVHL